MLFSGLALASLLLHVVATEEGWRPCPDGHPLDDPACERPMDDIVPVTPGSFYAAKITCRNCPYSTDGTDTKHRTVHGDQVLFFNITLSHDNRTILVNGQPFFPTLSTIPSPPTIYVPQLRPSFSNRNLSSALSCSKPSCLPGPRGTIEDDCIEWCSSLRLGTVRTDYLYTINPTEAYGSDQREDTQYWNFSIDALGRGDRKWAFDDTSQQMLRVVVAGTTLKVDGNHDTTERQGGGSLFAPVEVEDEQNKILNLSIASVQLVGRTYDFPDEKPLSLGTKLSRFFGGDIWQSKGRLLYLGQEWGAYGKLGSLRNLFGEFIHWDYWSLLAIIFGSTFGILISLFALYRFCFWIALQRELMSWNGMDDVWDKLRREREEEENTLLDGGYRDDPEEEGRGSRLPSYTDDIDTMKPLPVKPLPEKPLPEVPLIDA